MLMSALVESPQAEHGTRSMKDFLARTGSRRAKLHNSTCGLEKVEDRIQQADSTRLRRSWDGASQSRMKP